MRSAAQVLSPFNLALALCLGRIHRFEDQVIIENIIKLLFKFEFHIRHFCCSLIPTIIKRKIIMTVFTILKFCVCCDLNCIFFEVGRVLLWVHDGIFFLSGLR